MDKVFHPFWSKIGYELPILISNWVWFLHSSLNWGRGGGGGYFKIVEMSFPRMLSSRAHLKVDKALQAGQTVHDSR